VPTRGSGSPASAVTGLISVVLLFASIIALAARGEPPFTASNEEARAYFAQGLQPVSSEGEMAMSLPKE
jgi:hypothetical protein